MRPPRQLSADEALLWRKVADTVTPLERKTGKVQDTRLNADGLPAKVKGPDGGTAANASAKSQVGAEPAEAASFAKLLAGPASRPPSTASASVRRIAPPPPKEQAGLDASWERKFARGGLEPDFSLDLHGATLDQAYMRLMHGLAQARAMGARIVLVVTGRPRPTEAADRSSARGAIRAKIVDWLGASEHAGAIAAIRGAHRKHGGQGALYVVLRRRK